MGGDGRYGANSGITVFLIADSLLLRDGMARLIQRNSELRVVGSSPAAGLAWQEVAAARCGVVLAECATLKDALPLLEDLSSNVPESPLVIFGIYEDLELFLTLVSLRVSGYALAEASVDELVGLVMEVAKNDFLPCQALEPIDSESLVPQADVTAVQGGSFFSDC